MTFTYKAVTPDGKIVKGEIESKDQAEVVTYLHDRKMIPVVISKSSQNALLEALPFLKKNSFDLPFFTRQLSSMMSSGLTLVQALSVLKDQTSDPYSLSILSNMLTEIESGISFSAALAKYPKIFDPVYVALVKAAEVSGLFDKVLLRLSDNLEKRDRLIQSVRSALLYPSIVIIGMVAVMVIMSIYVVPQFSALYKSLNVSLPLPTRIVIGFSAFFSQFWFVALAICLGAYYAFHKWHQTKPGKLAVDTLMLKMPVFGELIAQTTLTEFTRTLSLLVGSGSLIVEALHQSAYVIGNVLYTNAALGVAERVEKGLTIGDAFFEFNLFPPILVQMSRIGEQTGKLDETLMRVSEYFEREVDRKVKNLTTLMEPFIVVFLGVGVAFLIISVVTPIYSLISSIH